MSEPAFKPHDIGGLPAGDIVTDEKDHALWEKRVDAIVMLLQKPERKLLRVDELRRSIESLGPKAYRDLGYYERWIFAVANVLLERGVITSEELGQGIADVMKRGEVLP